MRPRVTLSNFRVKEGHCSYTLGNLSIGAYCESKGNPVNLLSHSQDPDEIVKDILKLNPDICGFSVNYVNQDTILEVVQQIKLQSGATIILGGPTVTYSSPESKIRAGDADLYVRGDGEVAFNSVIDSFQDIEDVIGGRVHIQGVSSNNFHREELSLVDLTKMISPYPVDFESDHFYWETIRGCVFDCIYCNHAGGQNFFREIPEERLRSELEFFKGLDNLRAIYITDPFLGGKKERTKQVLKLISELNDVFVTASLRPEYLDDEMIKLLQEAKIGWLDIGLQTTNKDLAYFRKTGRRAFQELPKLHDAGVNYNLDLIVGIPGDTIDSVKESMRYVVEEARPTTFKAFRLRVYDETVLHRMALTDNWDFDEISRYMLSNQSFSKEELDGLMSFSDFTVKLYQFLNENNWFGNENNLRRFSLFEEFYAWARDKKEDIKELWVGFNEKKI